MQIGATLCWVMQVVGVRTYKFVVRINLTCIHCSCNLQCICSIALLQSLLEMVDPLFLLLCLKIMVSEMRHDVYNSAVPIM